MSAASLKVEVVNWHGKPTCVLNSFNRTEKDILCSTLENLKLDMYAEAEPCNCIDCLMERINIDLNEE